MIHAVDWDQTLVDTDTQEWLPGMLDKLRSLLAAGETVFVHSARANYDYGRASIEAKLREAGLRGVRVHPKPYADFYVDDKAQQPEQWLGAPVVLSRGAPGVVRRRPVAPAAAVVATAGWWRTQH